MYAINVAVAIFELKEKAKEKNMTEPGVLECAVITFGCNDDGQLGRGVKRLSTAAIDDVTDANYPQQVGALRGHDVIAVSCGSRHTMALTSKGEVFSWGWGTVSVYICECVCVCRFFFIC
jgi:hypothetical protein